MSTKDNAQSIGMINLLSKKILSTTLLERLNNVDDRENNNVNNNIEQYENSWRENVRGACGLFDISGFSRLAAKLSNEEKNQISPKQNIATKKSTDADPISHSQKELKTSQNSIQKSTNSDSFKIKGMDNKGRRASTIKALDTDIVEKIDSSTGSSNHCSRNLFRHANKILGEEMGKHGQGAEFLATFISEFFESLVEKIHDSGGDIIKFAGDCRMFWFLTVFLYYFL